jgi:hypothetical protein
MLNIHILIPLVVAVAMMAVVAIASGYPYLQAKLSVIFSGGLVLVLALVQLVRELRAAKQSAEEPKAKHKAQEQSASPAVYGLEAAWMAGFALAIYLLGFLIAIPLYICAYMKSHGARWLASILTGVLMAVFCYVIFVLVLEMKLHQGEIIIRLGLWQG